VRASSRRPEPAPGAGLRLRRAAPASAIGAAVAILVAACGGSGSSDTVNLKTTAKVNAACEQPAVRGGNLVYARQYETVSLNPLENKNGNGDIFADEMLYTPLVRLNHEGGYEIQPALAESWERSADGKAYTFHLRPGIRFSDGSPITAEDVVWSLEREANPVKDPSWAFIYQGYENAETVDPATVRVNLSEPVAAFLYDVAIIAGDVLPKELIEKEGAAFWKHPVGAGPFKLEEFSTGNHITFERNPYYWEKGKPYLDTVRWNFDTESNTRLLALKSGQAQIADWIPYSQISSLQSDPKLAVQEIEVPNWVFLLLNNKVPALGDLDVRTAINYALDREEINEGIFKGVGTVPNGLFAPMKFWDKSIPPYEYDLAKAKEYMAKSKYPNGFSMTLQYPSGSEFFKQLTLLLQQELGAIGIKLKLEEEPAATAFENWLNMKYEAIFQGPGVSSDVPVPDEYAGWFANPGPESQAFYTGWVDPQISKKVQKFRTTLDEESRSDQWASLQREFKKQSPSINVLDMPFVNAHATDVCGTAVNKMGVDRLELTWLAPAKES
jgi:peptide/nickel transport system substrate-binding protein